MYLPDSNVLILAFKNHEPEATFLRHQLIKRSLAISVIVVAEFLVGANEEQKKKLDSLLREFPALEINEKVARAAAEYRRQFLRKTKKVFMMDCFLAAQAKIHNLTLVTNNKSDFPMRNIKIVDPALTSYTRSFSREEIKSWQEEDKI